MTPVGIIGAAALSSHGSGWRGLGDAALAGASLHRSIEDPADRALAKQRKMMSRGAYLAARCLSELLRDATWPRDGAGYFLGVGASGGSLDDVVALLAASIRDGEFSLARFGDAGLGACNPLLAFQLMNNFTLCHGAILEGIGGPNAALFSRGAGTTAALVEAVHAITSGDCSHAIAGGADSALHPVTRSELARDGFIDRGLVPAEGAALLALGAGPALAVIDACAIANGHGRGLAETIVDAGARLSLEAVDHVVLAPWGPPAAEALRAWATSALPSVRIVDTSAVFGDSLAAGHALAWLVALDLIVGGRAHHVLVLGAGTDGDLGIVALRGVAA
jgi:hypothetical protein